jgi:hypothetical protein
MSTLHICPVCNKSVKIGLGIQHEVCKHYSHAHCMDQVEPNFEYCATCALGPTELGPTAPQTYNGRDYVANPLPSEGIRKLWKKMTRKLPHLSKGLDMKHLIAEHQYHLQYLLSESITMNELIQHGYTLKHMVEAHDDLAGKNGADRKLLALSALCCDATHFRSNENYQLVSDVVTPTELVNRFGLYFPVDAPLSVFGDTPSDGTPFTLKELYGMGFTSMQELIDAGMEYRDQYDDLMPDKTTEARMNITREDVARLPMAPAVAQQQQPQQHIVYVPVLAQAPAPIEPRLISRQPQSQPQPQYIQRHHGLKKK